MESENIDSYLVPAPPHPPHARPDTCLFASLSLTSLLFFSFLKLLTRFVRRSTFSQCPGSVPRLERRSTTSVQLMPLVSPTPPITHQANPFQLPVNGWFHQRLHQKPPNLGPKTFVLAQISDVCKMSATQSTAVKISKDRCLHHYGLRKIGSKMCTFSKKGEFDTVIF